MDKELMDWVISNYGFLLPYRREVDAEFSASPIYFPCEYSEIKDALDYLENTVNDFLID